MHSGICGRIFLLERGEVSKHTRRCKLIAVPRMLADRFGPLTKHYPAFLNNSTKIPSKP